MDASAGTCLLAGCGYAGTRLARRLGGPVLALVRSGASAAALARAGIPALAVDLDGGEPFPLPDDLATVTYLAPPGGDGPADARFRRFLAALGGARPRAMVYVGTTGVYGDAGGAEVDEATPPAPGDDRARQRLDAEEQARAWCAARGVRCVLLRVAAIYGPHRLPLDRLRRGEPVLRPEDTGPGNRIHVDDLVAACAAALAGPAEGVFNVADGTPWSPAEFTELVATLAGLPPPRRIGRAAAAGLLSPAHLAFFAASRRISNRRLVEELGVVPRHPEAGIRQSLAEMDLPG
ncbi:MAG TPA: NAD-dependent epimerase/dehydratase family protein [Holophagaceae bacterium]